MPVLLKSVKSNVLDSYVGNLYCFSAIQASVQLDDYVNVNGLIAYLQNYHYVESVTKLDKPIEFGLKNQYNLPTITLEISY